MTLKARRVVRELAEVLLAAPDCLPDGWRERAGPPDSPRHRRNRTGLHRRHDRPLRARRARPPVQAQPGPRMNPFRELLDLVDAADRGAAGRRRAAGRARPRPGRGRAAARSGARRGRDQRRPGAGQGRAASRRWPWPASSPRRWRARGDIAQAGRAAPGFVNLTMAPGLLAAAGAGGPGRRPRLWPQRRSAAAAGQCRVLLGQPDRARCMSAMAAARCSATRWPTSWRHAGFAVTREYYVNDGGAQIETLARSLHLRYREALGETIGEIPAGLYPGRLSDAAWRRRSPRATATAGAAARRGRMAASRSSAWASRRCWR